MNMRKVICSSLLVSVIMGFFQPVMARDNGDFVGLEGFVDGCSELVHIYEKRDQKRLLAGQTTSLSEALRAGYCRGVIEQYKQQNSDYSYGCHADWYALAKFVARQNGVESNFGSMDNLLETACRGR
jgi:hypothetical protein